MNMKRRPFVLNIAGFDPSNGAGLTADLKTMESIGVYGVSVCTANTVQNDIEFESCTWFPEETMVAQLNSLFNRFEINWVKIGIVKDWKALLKLIHHIKSYNSSIKIILDPILKATNSFDFQNIDEDEYYENFEKVLESVYLLTPNYNELERLYADFSIEVTTAFLRDKTNLLIKGGHHPSQKGIDELYLLNGEQYSFLPDELKVYEKHGSGCVLSSAITSYLALGNDLIESCSLGKEYIEKFLNSNRTLLGYHE